MSEKHPWLLTPAESLGAYNDGELPGFGLALERVVQAQGKKMVTALMAESALSHLEWSVEHGHQTASPYRRHCQTCLMLDWAGTLSEAPP